MASPEKTGIKDGGRYFSGRAVNGTMIYIGPITRDQLQDAGIVGPSTGYYLCEFDTSDPIGGLDVLASFASVDTAYRFAEVLGLHELESPIAEFEDPIVPMDRISST